AHGAVTEEPQQVRRQVRCALEDHGGPLNGPCEVGFEIAVAGSPTTHGQCGAGAIHAILPVRGKTHGVNARLLVGVIRRNTGTGGTITEAPGELNPDLRACAVEEL